MSPPADPLLTARQIEILAAVAAGRTYVQVAADLFLTYDTVKSHMRNVGRRLGTPDQAASIVHALARGIIAVRWDDTNARPIVTAVPMAAEPQETPHA